MSWTAMTTDNNTADVKNNLMNLFIVFGVRRPAVALLQRAVKLLRFTDAQKEFRFQLCWVFGPVSIDLPNLIGESAFVATLRASTEKKYLQSIYDHV
jgi:hypothetical protein